MHNLTDFFSTTGVNGVIRYTNRFSEHNIEIGVISNDSLYQIYKAVKSIRRLQTSGKYTLCDMFEGIYETRIPS